METRVIMTRPAETPTAIVSGAPVALLTIQNPSNALLLLPTHYQLKTSTSRVELSWLVSVFHLLEDEGSV